MSEATPAGEGSAAELEFERLLGEFQTKGIGGRVGFGERPALMVVDMILGFTDDRSPLGSDAPETVAEIARLLVAARGAEIPIVFSTCHFAADMPEAQAWYRKIPSQRTLEPGSRWVEVDPRLEPGPGETVLAKHFASCFAGTSLAAELRRQAVDSIVVTGMTTSGCVRATVVDGVSAGFRPIVPRGAVADRARLPHLASLFDIDAKYGDVVATDEVVAYLGRLAALDAPGSRSASVGA
jgi:nicotinamidase-related amidase